MSMEIIEKRLIIMAARDRWRRQYAHYKDDSALGWTKGTKADIEAKLDALDLATCSEADVDAAIGTTGWGANFCDECNRNVETTIQIGEQPGYDARWVSLCRDCVAEALKTLSK